MLALDTYAGPLGPDPVLPEQFFRPQSPLATSPEGRLMIAVVENALDSYLKNKTRHSRRACRLSQEAAEWFLSTDTEWPFSFENICMALGVDAQAARKSLLREGSQSQIPKVRLVTYNRPSVLT